MAERCSANKEFENALSENSEDDDSKEDSGEDMSNTYWWNMLHNVIITCLNSYAQKGTKLTTFIKVKSLIALTEQGYTLGSLKFWYIIQCKIEKLKFLKILRWISVIYVYLILSNFTC